MTQRIYEFNLEYISFYSEKTELTVDFSYYICIDTPNSNLILFPRESLYEYIPDIQTVPYTATDEFLDIFADNEIDIGDFLHIANAPMSDRQFSLTDIPNIQYTDFGMYPMEVDELSCITIDAVESDKISIRYSSDYDTHDNFDNDDE